MKNTLLFTSIILSLFSSFSFSSERFILESDISSLSFATIKKQYIVEPASITKLSGSIDEIGSFEISADLKNIDTGVAIRDVRLNDLFFESSKFPLVKVTGKIVWPLLNEGSSKITIPTEVTLFGKTKSINFPLIILKTNDTIMASSSIPVIITASDFGIPSDNLVRLADTVGGIKISEQVPVSINITFKKQ